MSQRAALGLKDSTAELKDPFMWRWNKLHVLQRVGRSESARSRSTLVCWHSEPRSVFLFSPHWLRVFYLLPDSVSLSQRDTSSVALWDSCDKMSEARAACGEPNTHLLTRLSAPTPWPLLPSYLLSFPLPLTLSVSSCWLHALLARLGPIYARTKCGPTVALCSHAPCLTLSWSSDAISSPRQVSAL